MEIKILKHARERMLKYGISQQQVLDCMAEPDSLVEGSYGRKIAQKRLNGYVLRVIYEEANKSKTVVTAYKAKRERYEI